MEKSTVLPVLAEFTVVGDNSSSGDSVYLYCARCPREGVSVVVPGTPELGRSVGRFLTNHWDDPPTVTTLADLVTAAREHNQEVHGGEAG